MGLINWLTSASGRRVVNRFREKILNFYQKFLIANSAFILAYLAIYFLHGSVKFWPIQYSTIVWLAAFALPAIAFLYSMFNLRVRLDEIADLATFNSLHRVYYPFSEPADSPDDFSRFLRNRFREYCNMWEMVGFSFAAGTVTFVILVFLKAQLSFPDGLAPFVPPGKVQPWVFATGSGFFGAFAGSLLIIYKRYRAIDIYPSTFLQVSVALVVGMLVGGFIASVYPTTNAAVLIFTVGFLTALNLNFLSKLMRQTFASLTKTQLPPEIPTDLGSVIKNSEAIESLNNMSLFSLAEFVNVEPVRLYLNMSQAVGVINGWLDEALLAYYFPEQLPLLNRNGIRRFTELLQLAVVGFGYRTITWVRRLVAVNDPATDATILSALRGIVGSRDHYRLLGILSTNYREAYFLP